MLFIKDPEQTFFISQDLILIEFLHFYSLLVKYTKLLLPTEMRYKDMRH